MIKLLQKQNGAVFYASQSIFRNGFSLINLLLGFHILFLCHHSMFKEYTQATRKKGTKVSKYMQIPALSNIRRHALQYYLQDFCGKRGRLQCPLL